MTKQNLVFYAPNVTGGVKVYLENLSEYLRMHDIEHSIILYGSHLSKTEILHYNDFVIHVKFYHDEYLIKQYKILSQFINEHSVVIANDRFEIDMCNFMKLRNKLIYIMHGDLAHYKSIFKLPIIDAVLFVSKALQYSYSDEILISSLAPPIVPNVALTKISEFPKVPRIIFVGRLEYLKGADEIRIASSLLRFKWQIYAPKSGSAFEFVEGILDLDIIWDQPNSVIMKNYIGHDFLFMPSRSEGFGMVVLEAMRFGVIPILRDIKMGIASELTDQENCIKFNTIQDLSDKIVRIQNNPEIQINLKTNAALWVNKFYNPDNIFREFINGVSLQAGTGKKYYRNKRGFLFRLSQLRKLMKSIYFKLIIKSNKL